METLEIKKTDAIVAHRNADNTGKKLLEDLFGEKTFNLKPLEWVKTFKDVCDAAGVNETDYSIPDTAPTEVMAAAYFKRLRLIQQVFNEGWEPNLADTSQNKYYPWFNIHPNKEKASGFGLSFVGCVFVSTRSDLGVRLACRNEELAKFMGTTFTDLYKDLLA